MANYYKNVKTYGQVVPIDSSATLLVESGKYVKGSVFARSATLGLLSDEGASEPAAVTADPTLLVFTQAADNPLGSTIGSEELDDASVTADKLADNAVTSAKLIANAVTTAKVADNAVTTAKVADNGVTTAKIANNAVTTAKVADNTVTHAKLTTTGLTYDATSILTLNVTAGAPPASAAATGTAGTVILGNDGYLYYCTATDTWKRVQLATW